MKHAEVAHAVVLTGGSNNQVAEIVHPHSRRLTGFAHHDPAAPLAANQLGHAIQSLGLKGYKLIAPQISVGLQDERLAPLWAMAEQLGIPVTVHFGVWGGARGTAAHQNINPLLLFPIARRHPTIPFIIPHFGSGYWRELLHLCWTCRNVLIDTSGSNEWLRWEPYPLDLSGIFRRAYETVGPERFLFGSDVSPATMHMGYQHLTTQLEACRSANIPDEAIRLIFGGNAARLLGLDLQSIKEETPGC